MHDWGEAVFNPRSIAVTGASANPGKLGQILMRNWLEGYPGKLFPINPNETEIMGYRAYQLLQDVPEPVDLAAIALPPELCVEAMGDCARSGARVALVLSGGFAEIGPEGKKRQDAMLEAARAGGVRLIGPNCFGLYNCNLGLNLSMGFGLPPKGGNISLVTQSGAYGMAIFGLAQQRHLRFAKILSHGNKADLTDHEILDYFARDDETDVLCLFLESVSDGRAFYEALARAARCKLVVFAKTGRSSAGRRAAASHTAALAGDATAFATAVQQAGAILAESGLEMVDIAEALSRQPLPPGRRVGIITNSGGTGVEITDMCERFGLSVPELPPATQARISPLIPAYASPRNPVDVTPLWARFPAMYGGSIEALYECDEIDIIIPILLQRSALMRENVQAVRDAVVRCQQERRIAKPTYISHKSDVGGVRIGVSPANVRAAFEEMLADVRAKQPAAHILGISVQELVHGQEVIIGGLHDAEFGPMVLFGLGGIFVEILRDVAYRLVPASTDELHSMIQEVRGYPLLEGARGKVAVDVEAIIQTLQAAAWLLIEFPEIRELDLNPVIVGTEGAIVADGRAVLAVSQ